MYYDWQKPLLYWFRFWHLARLSGCCVCLFVAMVCLFAMLAPLLYWFLSPCPGLAWSLAAEQTFCRTASLSFLLLPSKSFLLLPPKSFLLLPSNDFTRISLDKKYYNRKLKRDLLISLSQIYILYIWTMLHISRPFLATVVSSCMKLFSQLDNPQLPSDENERKGESVRRRRRRGRGGGTSKEQPPPVLRSSFSLIRPLPRSRESSSSTISISFKLEAASCSSFLLKLWFDHKFSSSFLFRPSPRSR